MGRRAGARVASSEAGSPQPADRGEPGHARFRVGLLEQLGDDAARELGSGPRDPYRQAIAARTAGLGSASELGSGGIAASAASVGRPRRAPGSPPSRTRGSSGRPGRPRRRRRRSAGRRARAIASSAATRTVGSGSSSTAATSAAPGIARPTIAAEQARGHPADAPAAAPGARRRALRCTAGSRVSTARPGPPSRTCSPSPARSVRRQARGVAPPDAEDDDVHSERGQRAEPEHLVAREERARPRRSRTPDRIVPTWPGTPSLKARTWARRSVGTTL